MMLGVEPLSISLGMTVHVTAPLGVPHIHTGVLCFIMVWHVAAEALLLGVEFFSLVVGLPS